jgi:hypothetical protein
MNESGTVGMKMMMKKKRKRMADAPPAQPFFVGLTPALRNPPGPFTYAPSWFTKSHSLS